MTTVSVIVPAYNVEHFIAATIQSVLTQTYSDFELIIVDDGSPDRTVDICQGFGDPRLKIIRQENRGVCAARNAGIRQAQGRYIAFLDGDDLWEPQKLEKHVQHLDQSPEVGISFCRSAFIDEHGQPLGIYQMPKLQNITPALILCRNPIGNGSAPVIRREVFEEIKVPQERDGVLYDCYFDEQLRHFEDVECWLRIALKTNWQIEGIPEALTLYRVTQGGASSNLAKQLADLEKVIEKTNGYAPELIDRYGNAARAYELRFLARRAVSLKAGVTAVRYVHQALAVHWRILIDEPYRTLLTLAAAYSIWLLPQSLYQQLEMTALKMTGASQKRRIQQEQAKQIA